ncbi:hypothetical protein ACWIGI_05620 [Nocardia sp. NPDC055321]
MHPNNSFTNEVAGPPPPAHDLETPGIGRNSTAEAIEPADESGGAATAFDSLAALLTRSAELTRDEYQAFALGLIDSKRTDTDFADGVLRGLWFAVVIVAQYAPGTRAELGRRLLQLDHAMPRLLRRVTPETDEPAPSPADVPDDVAAEFYHLEMTDLSSRSLSTRFEGDRFKWLLANPERPDQPTAS